MGRNRRKKAESAGLPPRSWRERPARAVPWLWCAYFGALFGRMLKMRPDGIHVGHEVLWSDWALHLGFANLFATKPPSLWFAYHPVFADGKLTYAFLTNLVSALLMRAGLSVEDAFILPSILLAGATVWALWALYRALLGSEWLAGLAATLFFLAGGFGAMPERGWFENTFLVGHLLPQRAFLLGLPLALAGVTAILRALQGPAPLPGTAELARERRTLALAGLGVGLLPIAHMHSLIALSILLLPLAAAEWRHRKRMLWFAVPAAALSSLLYLVFIHGGIQKPGFMSVLLGFGARGPIDWLAFWGKAWGAMVPLAAAGLALALRSGGGRAAKALLCGFFLLFALANVIQFQPTTWDNSKLFLWCYVGFAALAARALARLWTVEGPWRWGARPAAAALTVSLVALGTLKAIDIQRVGKHTYRLLSREQLELAGRLRAETPPLARFATAPNHDHPISVWAARPVLLGYISWVINFGFDYEPVERDLRKLYEGGPDVPELVRKHRIDYIYLGPSERHHLKPNEDYFKTRCPLAFESSTHEDLVYQASGCQ